MIPIFETLLAELNKSAFSKVVGKFIPPPYLYKRGSVRFVVRNDINFELDLSETVDHFIFFNYQDLTLNSFFSLADKANVILDIGANIGWTALSFAKRNPEAKIIAFEPHPITFEKAARNIRINDINNIELLNIGLGESTSILKMYEVSDHNSGMNRIVLTDEDLPYREVQIKRLDDVMNSLGIKKVDLIKIDVEGFEAFVLKGASDVLAQCNATILMETDDGFLKYNGSSARELISILQGYGYRTFYRSDKHCFVEQNDDLINCHFDLLCTKK
jgi:FkbM family methyltransferase